MSNDDSAPGSEDGESPGESYKELRAQLRSLPRRTAPPSFEAELEQRLNAPARPPSAGVLRMHPFLTGVTTIGGVLLLLSFLVFPGGVDTTGPSAVSPATEIAPDAAGSRIQAKADTADGDSLARVKRIPAASR